MVNFTGIGSVGDYKSPCKKQGQNNIILQEGSKLLRGKCK